MVPTGSVCHCVLSSTKSLFRRKLEQQTLYAQIIFSHLCNTYTQLRLSALSVR